MEVIRKKIRVDASRRVTVELPEHVPPGEHDVLVVLARQSVGEGATEAWTEAWEERTEKDSEEEPLGAWLRRTAHDTGPVDGTTYRREDIYGDEGR